ncbi:mechanosensitive ion channel [Echinicola jeungdonensis]|uniref:Mechanosensitive ion channel family protein n=1 Tax=Echinicola jeungdonensis TaxID=709343 RepID=A0ABV5J983_9BACT|nr:mechanosensitive ion channel domain-containing protein [Echinicola jeungdonensis]MDN3669163.1 mechanosensitive ion channel [Echinicola jeungdonensis]
MDINAETLQTIYDQGVELLWRIVPNLLYAIIIYLVGAFIIKKILGAFQEVLDKRKDADKSLSHFLSSIISAILYILLFLTIGYQLGIPLTSFVAIIGAAGLAIGLALQGSLANFAGGVLILLFKPFKVGDVIEGKGHLGVVETIDILYTKMKSFDNKDIIIPNGGLANSDIINMSNKPTRRAEFSVGVAYGTDLKKVREIILGVFEKDERIHQDPAPVVFFSSFGESSLDLSIRVWTDAANLWPVYFDNMEAMKEAFEANDIEIPFPQRDIIHHYPEGKPA